MHAPLTLLMIAFEFPPLDTVGVRRSAGLARHLPEFGVTPVVVTTDRPSLTAWTRRPLRDQDGFPSAMVHRVAAPLPAPPPLDLLQRPWHFFAMGGDIGTCWGSRLAPAWDVIVADTAPRAVYVSLPPARVAPIVVRLATRSRLPLILDFRDHWSQWGDQAFPTPLHYRRELRAEGECLAAARAVIGVTAQLVRDLQRAHPDVDVAKFHVVPNGWDEAESAPPVHASRQPDGTFIIGHAGRFYYSPAKRAAVMEPWWRKSPAHWSQYTPRREDWLYRSPYFLFRAVRRLLDRRPELEGRLRLKFAGEVEDWFAAQVAEFRLQGVVEHMGRLSHEACLAFEARCDALLVTSVKVPAGRDYCIAGKTFEYLTMGRPILGIVTAGEQRDFLAAAGGAVIADADDVEGSARAIEQLIDGGAVPARDEAVIAAHHRREMTRRIAGIARQVATS